jgi:hypothetical protein
MHAHVDMTKGTVTTMSSTFTRRTLLGAGSLALLSPLLGACEDMPSMIMPTGDGTTAQAGDMTLKPVSPTSLASGQPTGFAFQVMKDRKPFTDFVEDMTKKMHFYAVRTDLTGYQHLHPEMAGDGTWTTQLAAMEPGTWRFYTAFTANSGGNHTQYLLGQQVTVEGAMAARPLPPPATTAQSDGYTLTMADTKITSDMYKPQSIKVDITMDGMAVMDLQPYLGARAHLTAIRSGDMMFAHMHPQDMDMGSSGSAAETPTLSFEAMFPKDGDWRLFLQFQTMGTLHLAEFTLAVGK